MTRAAGWRGCTAQRQCVRTPGLYFFLWVLHPKHTVTGAPEAPSPCPGFCRRWAPLAAALQQGPSHNLCSQAHLQNIDLGQAFAGQLQIPRAMALVPQLFLFAFVGDCCDLSGGSSSSSALKPKWMVPIFLAALEQSHERGRRAASHSQGQWASHPGSVQRDTKPSLHQALISLLGQLFGLWTGRGEEGQAEWSYGLKSAGLGPPSPVKLTLCVQP